MTEPENVTRPEGSRSLRVVGAPPLRPSVTTVADAARAMTPRAFGPRWLSSWRRQNLAMRTRSLRDMAAFEAGRLPFLGQLWVRKIAADGEVLDYGLVSCRVVTNAGVGYIVDAFQNLVELENMKYHAVGTGTTAEAVTQTALVTELTTQYSPANTRPTGTTGEQSGSANVYETSATITVSAAAAITEHGILSQAAVGGGVLLDRSVFAAVNLGASESLQATYRLTVPSGG